MRTIYMNNAATSWPKAPGIGKVVEEQLTAVPLHPGRAGFDSLDLRRGCRSLLAELLQVKIPEQIVLCHNATHALNIVLHGFPWKKEWKIITTAAEHNSVLRPINYVRKHRDIDVKILPVDNEGRVIPEKWEKAVKQFSPHLVVFTHASNVTGAINPVAELSKIAKEAGALTLLDASQTLGLEEVHPESWGIDFVAFTGHKYLLGPPGTGGLYIAPGVEIEPVWVGGTGILSDLDEMPPMMPERFEAGTPNEPALAGLAHALGWQKENPVNLTALHQKTQRLSEGLIALGLQVINVKGPRTPVISFTVPGWEVEEVGEILYKSFNLICRTGLHCAPLIHQCLNTPSGTIRFSLSRFTTNEDIDSALSALKRILL